MTLDSVYQSFTQKPTDDTLYKLFNCIPINGFDKERAHSNMRIIVRKFHPDKLPTHKATMANEITKVLTATWRILKAPDTEICYRVLGRFYTKNEICIDWETIDKVKEEVFREWIKIKESENILKENNNQNRPPKREFDEKFKEEPYENKKAKVSKVTRIIDHGYKHKKYTATVEWDDGSITKMLLDETVKLDNILADYLLQLLKQNSKRYNWLKKNQPQLFM